MLAKTAQASLSLAAAALFAAPALAQTTELLSVDSAGVQGNQFSQHAAVSADGKLVAFDSVSTNLVAGDTNNADDVFLRDRVNHLTTLVSVATGGAQGDNGGRIPSLSSNGRYVAFHSAASNLVAGDTNNAWDVFVHDRQTGTTTRVSVSSTGQQAVSSCSNASLSADGRYVAFHSASANLVTGDTNAAWDIFVHDMQTGATTRVSLATGGTQGNGSSVNASLSGDGRYVAFHSAASNLVPFDVNAAEDVFVHDRSNGTTTRVSLAPMGFDANGVSRYASISGDGRFVAFESLANNIDPLDGNGAWDIFVRDLGTGVTERVSVGSSGVEGNATSANASLSFSGGTVAFDSYASTLDPLDHNNNGDVFAHDRGASAPYIFCTAGTTTHGCTASMAYAGAASASASAGFTITVSNVEGQRQGILFYGLDNSSFVPLPWGPSSSFMCVKSPAQRTAAQSSGGTLNACNGVFSLDWNAFMAANPSALGNPRQAGQSVFAQAWFRDPPSPKTTMLSNAIGFVVGP